MTETGTHGNGAAKATATEPRLWWLLVFRAVELELRRRRRAGNWRFTCPADGSHEVTIANGSPGLALTCHGPAGRDAPGHAAAVHRKARDMSGLPHVGHAPGTADLFDVPWPCRWCGCPESVVLAALGARPRDKFRQGDSERCSSRACSGSGYRVGRLQGLCLPHLSDRVGLPRVVLFGEGPR